MWSKKFCGNIRVGSKAYLYSVTRWNFQKITKSTAVHWFSIGNPMILKGNVRKPMLNTAISPRHAV